MIETKIPHDIMKYKNKAVGFFTVRETVCIGLAFIANVAVDTFIVSPLGITGLSEFRIGIIMLVAAPFLAFGFLKPRGVYLEKWAKSMAVFFFAPLKRVEKGNRLTGQVKHKTEPIRKKELEQHPEYKAYK